MPTPPVVQIPAVNLKPVLIPDPPSAPDGPFNFNLKLPPRAPSWLSKKAEEFGESLVSNPHLRLRTGMEMRTSLLLQSERELMGPLYYASSTELSQSQYRLLWGHITEGFRIDSTSGLGLRFGDAFEFEAGYRSTNASGEYKEVEEQRVGYVQATILKTFSIRYYNDHYFPFFPMGGGTDQGDTAGLDLGVRLGRQGVGSFGGFRLTGIGAHLHLATGIPDRNSTTVLDGKTYYTNVRFDEISQSVLSVSGTFYNPQSGISLTADFGMDSGAVGDATQNRLVHGNLGIPYFHKPDSNRLYVGFTITIPVGK